MKGQMTAPRPALLTCTLCVIAAGLGIMFTSTPAAAQLFDPSSPLFEQPSPYGYNGISGFTQVILNVVLSGIAFAIGYGLVILFKEYRRLVLAALIGLAVLVSLVPGLGLALLPIFMTLAFAAGITVALARYLIKPPKPTTSGSAEWATPADIQAAGLDQGRGFFLGDFPMGENLLTPLHYGGDRHLLTVAPTRAGKGVSAIIPNLLTYEGSILVIDPKGENALITATQRERLGQTVMLVDPWDLAATRMGTPAACFNPLDWLRPDDPDMAENAMLLADALVVPSGGGKDKFWDEEAKALLVGLILYVATDAEETDHRNLGRVRDLLMYNKDGMQELFGHMALSENPIVASTGARSMLKSEELLGNVLATAQAQTHFLDSPRIRESLSQSDFQFEDLKTARLSVYLILPADRLNAFGRWLRLLIQQAITVNARNIDRKPEKAVLFMLDEMPALGHLVMVEQAFGLMAGFGIQIWGIVQDLSQLKRIYGDGWETFIGNSGVLQYFGSRDQMTAEYFSKLCGVTTVQTLTEAISRAVTHAMGGNSNTYTLGTTTAHAQRNLAYPDELMTLRRDQQLLLVENNNPIKAVKVAWFSRPALQKMGNSLQ